MDRLLNWLSKPLFTYEETTCFAPSFRIVHTVELDLVDGEASARFNSDDFVRSLRDDAVRALVEQRDLSCVALRSATIVAARPAVVADKLALTLSDHAGKDMGGRVNFTYGDDVRSVGAPLLLAGTGEQITTGGIYDARSVTVAVRPLPGAQLGKRERVLVTVALIFSL